MRSFLLSFSLLAGTAFASQAPATPVDASAGVPALQRIAIVGASVSDGFGLELDVGVRTSFADVIEASLKGAHGAPIAHASTWLFANTLANARQLTEGAREKNPTLVVALDFLFWFGYGTLPTEADRLAMLDKGFKELEKFTCPVVVGDFADMRAALHGESPIGPMLSAEQVPSPETLKKLNERLTAWAAEHPNVIVVPLASLAAKFQADEPITIHGNAWPKGSLKTLLRKDLLHPTLKGAIAVWLSALEQLVTTQKEIPAAAFEWDAAVIEQKVQAAKGPERAAKAKAKEDAERKRRQREEDAAAAAAAEAARAGGKSKQ